MAKQLVLGLGNDLLGDDQVGLLVTERLRREWGTRVDLITSNLCGISLLDLFIGYETAIVVDALTSGKYRRGTIVELTPDDLMTAVSPSPHYAGLSELMVLARELDLEFPHRVVFLGVEIGQSSTIGRSISPTIARAAARAAARVRRLLKEQSEDCLTATARVRHDRLQSAASRQRTQDA